MNDTRNRFSEVHDELATKANEMDIRRHIREQVNTKADEVVDRFTRECADIRALIQFNHDETAKYLKYKFE